MKYITEVFTVLIALVFSGQSCFADSRESRESFVGRYLATAKLVHEGKVTPNMALNFISKEFIVRNNIVASKVKPLEWSWDSVTAGYKIVGVHNRYVDVLMIDKRDLPGQEIYRYLVIDQGNGYEILPSHYLSVADGYTGDGLFGYWQHIDGSYLLPEEKLSSTTDMRELFVRRFMDTLNKINQKELPESAALKFISKKFIMSHKIRLNSTRLNSYTFSSYEITKIDNRYVDVKLNFSACKSCKDDIKILRIAVTEKDGEMAIEPYGYTPEFSGLLSFWWQNISGKYELPAW